MCIAHFLKYKQKMLEMLIRSGRICGKRKGHIEKLEVQHLKLQRRGEGNENVDGLQ